MTTRKKKTSRSAKPLLAYTHAEAKRVNLPTDQTEPIVREDELAPVPFTPEARAPEGPRLSWRRGDSLNDLTTSAGPLFVHEKVSPTAFAEQLKGEPAPSLFAEFNGLPPDAAWSCYTHRGNWSNRIIRGHSEDVMASLAGKEDLAGKVQMIYWDPPYGINFNASYQPSTKKRAGGAPAEASMATAFRDAYRDGIHSYLDAVYRTATFGRQLLTESGSFFLQISSENLHRCALVLDEVFGPQNRLATIAFAKSGVSSAKIVPEVTDYLLWYARDKDMIRSHKLYEPVTRASKIELMSWHAMVQLKDGTRRELTEKERIDPGTELPEGARVYQRVPLDSIGESATGRSESFSWNGCEYACPPGRHWAVSEEGMERLADLARLDSPGAGGRLRWMRFESEFAGPVINNVWPTKMSPDDMHYVVETGESVIERCILMATDPGDLVLDPTCGSGTTAFVAEKWGRRWITIDASAIPVALARQRALSGVHEWFLTKDDPEGRCEEARLSGKHDSAPLSPDGTRSSAHDPASGFVYERVPYVSPATLAYDQPPSFTFLVDRPRKKKGWKRLASPFTVESHSPWRYEPVTGGAGQGELRQGVRERVLESLSHAGFAVNQTNVWGRGAASRWHLDDIENWREPSDFVTHEARLRETGDRVALTILSDDQTATRALMDRAADEAAKRHAIRKLIVAAFEYDADPAPLERRGRLEILRLRANRDLAIAELKPGREDHAFVLVGEPELDLRALPGERFEVEVRGWNTYDPATGNVRAGKPADIDCWLLDTDHDGQSFFARRIHFPGKSNDRQLKRFKAALGSRIKPEHWASMESLTSAPFRRPKSGRIAVRIVTTTGDEMLAVRDVPSRS